MKRLREMVAKPTYELTEDDWKVLEFHPWLGQFFETLDESESRKWGYKEEQIAKERSERFTKMFKDILKDRYHSWWKVYDKDGKLIWRMSPQHKASLARMRHFASLTPDEQWEIFKREFRSLFTTKDDCPGEKFAKVIAEIFAFLLALLGVEENRDQPAPQPA